MNPEARARQNIDAQLTACGWVVQDRAAMNLYAGRGVAVREFPLQTGYADYLLFVDRKAAGVLEAKAEGIPLAGVAEQAGGYAVGLPANVPHVDLPLPFLYESTGVETFFRDNRDPEPRSRRVYAFHRPETLAEWIDDEGRGARRAPGDAADIALEPGRIPSAPTLRGRLRVMPEAYPLITDQLWHAQVEAIRNLEASFAADRPRALIQMATGSGKTFTAVNFVYRLVKHAKARRVLFLVDRNNLGRQTFKEFDQFVTPDDGRKFSELYNVQHLQSNTLDDVSKVHITTIQRLYSMLCGETEFDPANEEGSLWEADGALTGQAEKEVRYNPRIPIEYYDFIITDECHRSIYNLWRQALEYFDAYLIGLTATPSKQTFGFFNQNLVMEYSRQRAVADGVNVDGEVYRIRTRISEQGSTIEKGWWVGRRDKRTRRQRWEQLDEDFSYDPEELDRRVSAPGQIRTILSAYKDSLAELFPGRNETPKTLVFAKDDNHAEEIVRIAREVFGKGDDFCQKITYRTAGPPENLISAFRTSYNPRLAVTVDMIATGTDIKPLEALLFLRAVRSRVLFEQMLGRGTRVISETDFQSVSTTPNARKTRFVIVDAVGVTEQELIDTGTVERKRSVSLKSLLEAVAVGAVDDDLLGSLARRVGLLEKRLSPTQRAEVESLLDVPAAPERFTSLRELSNALLDAIDADKIYALGAGLESESANPDTARPAPTDAELEAARQELIARAVTPLAASPELRAFLLEREILIDETSVDEVTARGFDADATARARQLVESFQAFIQENRDEITALQIIYSIPRRDSLASRTGVVSTPPQANPRTGVVSTPPQANPRTGVVSTPPQASLRTGVVSTPPQANPRTGVVSTPETQGGETRGGETPPLPRLSFAAVKELAEILQQPPRSWTTEELWRAYAQLEKDRVRGAGERRILADLVSLVRHAALDEALAPYPERVQARYREWLEAQGKEFTPQQRWWLDEIARHIGVNLSIRVEDLNSYGFQGRGGQVVAMRLFGVRLPEMLEELNKVLT